MSREKFEPSLPSIKMILRFADNYLILINKLELAQRYL
jgi:hypothetical protein